MAKQTKLESALEVFEDKLKELSVRIDTCIVLEKKLDLRVKEIDAKRINVDYSAFNSAIEQSKSNFDKQQAEIDKNFNQYAKTIKDASKKSEQHKLYFYSAMVSLFFLSLAFLVYGINQNQKKINAENKEKFYRIEAQRRFQYLKEKKLSNQYNKWLESKSATGK